MSMDIEKEKKQKKERWEKKDVLNKLPHAR